MVAVIRDNQDPRQAEEFLDELEFLAETADIVSVKRFTQRLPQPSARIYVGPGKLEEIAGYCREQQIDVVIFDDELSPSQMRVLEEELGVRVLDRSGLILDIFAQRARTREGQLQVELAQYQYLLPRLTGMWTHLVRQTASGGSSPIGTRGPGETQLETTTRRLRLDETQEVLLSDTVGFIRKLPTHLIEAFKATLEELSYADVLLHVIDISNPEWEAQARVVDGLISQLGASETPCLRVFNKCDAYIGILPHGDDIVCISARSGEGADALVSKLLEMLDRGKKQVRLEIPYSEAELFNLMADAAGFDCPRA